MFYEFHQNNSGGGFSHDPERGIGYVVLIEAKDADQANQLAEAIGLYFNGVDSGSDCDCCGDRWYEVSGDGDEVPLIYDKPAESFDGSWGIPSFIHYLDGRIVEIPDKNENV